MPSKLLKNGTVITFDDATLKVKVLPRASILIVDDRITAISDNADDIPTPLDAEIIDVEGKIVSPGFVNTHVHMWQTVFRTIAPDIILAQYFDWLSAMSPTATKPFTPDDVYISCLEGYLEGLNAGVTSYVDHAHNNWKSDIVKPGYQAAVDSGARVWWCYDVTVGNEGFPEMEQWKVFGAIAEEPSPSRVQLGLSLDGLAGEFATDTEVHVDNLKNATKKMNLTAITMHYVGGPWPQASTTPTIIASRNIHTANIPIIFSHASFLSPSDMSALTAHNLFISITPESEFHYGHGQATGHLCAPHASLGVDTAFTFSGDMLYQARIWLQAMRNTNYRKTLDQGRIPNQNPMKVEQAFLLATRQGGLALRRPDIGVLQVGAKADIVVFNGDSPNMLGWSDPVAAVILHANAADVEHVLVDGQFRKRNFKLVGEGLGWEWEDVKKKFVEAARRIQPLVKTPTKVPEKLWGVGEMGDVDVVSTIV
ncbi:putative chlorohydrolase family protein [Phaeosphaeriaceae sp. PMI808]|nr:putative chlorohydrolase family protein [Phaeosphaeriaceae sp. PMI808]